MSTHPSPLVERRRLRTELRKARQDAGLTQDAVADQMDWSLSKVIRIETGSVGISTNDLTALLRLYGVKDQKLVEGLVSLGRAARQQTWWSKYRGIVPPTYFQYIEYETAASIIREYQALLVPGLLQTEEYAQTVMHLYRPKLTARGIKARVEIRMKRQQLLLERESPPLLFFILDESVITRLVGDKNTRQAQVMRLIEMADHPHVTIEIVPFSVGLHRGMAENFSILEFSGSTDSDILYIESASESIFSQDEAQEISIFRELFEDLRKVSLGPRGSRDYLAKIADAIM